ncbi:MAG TPA: hypothetical protein VFX70_10295 [Mycobacteriales bacterium]|nr:hypothetical protein [Mycobacteriales bacterium]
MSRRGEAMTAPGTDYLPPELATLVATATRVINEHVADNGLCAVCGSAWPCARAVLAEHNLAEV